MTRHSKIWHPFTQHGASGRPIAVERAEGAYLYTKDRRQILDGISSWWVNTHGHCHPKLVKAVQDQAAKLEQVIFSGFTHDPAEALAEGLLKAVRAGLGDHLAHVFFSDSGSTAVEVALKMAIGYHAHRGEERRILVALEGGYHGDTFGTMSAGARGVFNDMYAPYLFDVVHLPFPEAGKEEATIAAYQKLLKDNKDQVAAFVFEPLVQGAAGMKMYSPDVLRALADMSKKHGVLTIADEVMTGFGRTGTMFACERAGFSPDLLCLSKGLTGGFLPMGATLCSHDIFMAFYSDDRRKQFFHSSSFTGNALACASALASLEIWDEEPVMERIARIEKSHLKATAWFGSRPDVVEARALGSIFALDVRDDVNGYLSSAGPFLYDAILKHDVLLRPIGNTVYILPPYCTTTEQLEVIYDALWQALDALRDTGKKKAA